MRHLLCRERELWGQGIEHVAGVDEAGVGPLAGPVVAAAVVFPRGDGVRGVHDSKRLTAARRVELAEEIRRRAVTYAVVSVGAEEIDSLNIYHAGLEAMRRAVERLDPSQLRWEPSRGGDLFPHLYGPMRWGMVVAEHAVELDAEGSFLPLALRA